MTAMRRVGIDARLIEGIAGGVQQAVTGLVSGLSQLTDGEEEYLILAYADSHRWIEPSVHGACRLILTCQAPPLPKWRQWLRSTPLTSRMIYQASRLVGNRAVSIPVSDGRIEELGVALMHFPLQGAFRTSVPSIYQPWDLQHVHLPQFFSPRERMARDVRYHAFCEQAQAVLVTSSWGRFDLIQHFGLPEDKVQVIPWAPAIDICPDPLGRDLERTREKFSLPEAFVFYPAQTWPHKNHLRLLEAVAILRDQHRLEIPLILSGHMNEFSRVIQKRVRDLRLDRQVRFLGYVEPLELRSLYRLCRCVVFPTKFEGLGMPILEAFQEGVPVACSTVTCLPEIAADAALTFDPDQPYEIAETIRSLWTSVELRAVLVERGKQRASRMSPQRTARIVRAHYRRVAGWPLTSEDREWLELAA